MWGVISVAIVAAVVTLALGFTAYHFRMRYHAQAQIKEIMCAPHLCIISSDLQ